MRQDRLTPAGRGLRGGRLSSRVETPAVEPLHIRTTEPSVLEDRYLGGGAIGQRGLGETAQVGGRASAPWLPRPLNDRGLVYRPTRGTYDSARPMLGSYRLRRVELTELAPRR